jgi:voltage-gated potassium channel
MIRELQVEAIPVNHPWRMTQRLEFLKNESATFLVQISKLFRTVIFQPGEIIIKQGEDGDCMYFIQEGNADIWLDGALLANLGPGIPFGEMALFSGQKRIATVRAQTLCVTQRLSKEDFDLMRSRYPEFNERIHTLIVQRTASNLSSGPHFPAPRLHSEITS